jgi:hypothetical protein
MNVDPRPFAVATDELVGSTTDVEEPAADVRQNGGGAPTLEKQSKCVLVHLFGL